MRLLQSVFVFFLLIYLAGCAGSSSQQSSPGQSRFKINPPAGFDHGSYFFDRVSGNIWRRCDLGKKYSATESKCVGQSITASWPEAVAIVHKLNEQNFEGANDWRLPTKDDLASLLLNQPSFWEIKSMRHHKYGFAKDDWYADYGNNVTINYGGWYGGYDGNIGGRGEGQCKLAGQMLKSALGSVNEIDLYSARDLPPKSHYRWMSDNYKWRNGQRLPPESNDWQNPRSFDFTLSCSNILKAFYVDTADAQIASWLVSHAEVPLTIVRGGGVPQVWIDAQVATKNIQIIIERSRADQNARLNSVASFYSAIGNKIKDVVASAGNSAPVASSGQASQDSSTLRSSSSNWRCEFLCGKTAHTINLDATDNSDAQNRTMQYAKQNCWSLSKQLYEPMWGRLANCSKQ